MAPQATNPLRQISLEGGEGSSSSRISSPMGMHSHRSLFSEQRRVVDVSITGVRERDSAFTPQ